MLNVDQIRDRLRAVVEGGLDLDAFDEWLSKHSWNMHKDCTPEALKLVGRIELLLADFDNDRISLDALMREFRLLSPIFERVEAMKSEFSSELIPTMYEWSVASDRRFSMGFSYTPLPQV